jgi:hypothetical protein
MEISMPSPEAGQDGHTYEYGARGADLDLLLKSAQEQYNYTVYSTKNVQNSGIHNYLWLSSAVLAAEAAILFRLTFPESSVTAYPAPWYVLVGMGLAICICFVAFLIAVDALRGRAGTPWIIPSSYDWLMKYSSGDDLRRRIIVYLDKELEQVSKVSDKRGKCMRLISILILASSFIGGVSFAAFILPYIMKFIPIVTV